MNFYLYLVSLAAIGIFTWEYFRLRDHYKDNGKALFVKACGTCISVFLCFYAAIQKNTGFEKWILFAGIFICMIADVIIGMNFVAGMMTFFAAHLCFIAYYFILAPLNPASIPVFVVLYLVQCVVYGKHVFKLGKQAIAYILYPAALSFMFSVAVFLPFAIKSPGAVCIAVGAGLFLVSDSILANTRFFRITKWKDRFVMYLYYPAVYLLAVSAFYL